MKSDVFLTTSEVWNSLLSDVWDLLMTAKQLSTDWKQYYSVKVGMVQTARAIKLKDMSHCPFPYLSGRPSAEAAVLGPICIPEVPES